MKTIIKTSILLVLFNVSSWIIPQKTYAQVSVSFQAFYDDLSPYGTWIDNPQYGYVWVPNVGAGFAPYSTNGYWVLTDYGWTWVSYYPWGWAPFHYGRWYTDPVYGPAWVPDTEWGPAWVTWRTSADYYGWAPIEPGISISVAYSNAYNVPYEHWRFVRCRDFGRTNINNYYVQPKNNVTIIKNTTVINNPRVDNSRNVTYNAGPNQVEVQKHIGKPVTPVTVKENNKPGQQLQKGQLNIYRPQVQKNAAAEPKPAPSKVGNTKEIKVPAQNSNISSQKNVQPAKQKTMQPQQNTNQPMKQRAISNQPASNVNQAPKQKTWAPQNNKQSNNNSSNKQFGQPAQNSNQSMEQKVEQPQVVQQPMKQNTAPKQQPPIQQNKIQQVPNINQPVKQETPQQKMQQPTNQPENMPQPMKQSLPPQNVQQPISRPLTPPPNMNQQPPMRQSPPIQRQFPQQPQRQPGKK